MAAKIEATLTSCASKLEGQAGKIATDLKNFLGSFLLLATDPVAFRQQALSSLLNLLGDVTNTLLIALDTIIETVLEAFPLILSGIQSLLWQPIHIPVISDLWQAISGDPLSALDLLCLMVAIPTTIIQKAVSASNNQVGSINGQQTAWAFSTTAGCITDSFCDVDANNTPSTFKSLLDVGFVILTFGLSFPATSLSAATGILWAEQAAPILWNGSA
ncbi:hypothetical protein [Paludibaculum fermentans]|uniref:Uncharacterized protein n=1 Tax=Paludibaculum fermentans TaxID=1473598 RepID=A0A7S7SME3_PALFE|nr:hypothetical protein [Paludibaculum fermentans]QOY90354.1 hypothetical protein IRI77_10480 [Paludibaculum fermentans]